MTGCMICQAPMRAGTGQRFPGYSLCDPCRTSGYKLTLGGNLSYCILIPSPPPGPAWLMRCAEIVQLLRQETIPLWLGPRARRNPHPSKNRKEEINATQMPAEAHHQ